MKVSDKNSLVMKRLAIKHQIRKCFIRNGMYNSMVADVLRSFNLHDLRSFRKMFNAY